MPRHVLWQPSHDPRRPALGGVVKLRPQWVPTPGSLPWLGDPEGDGRRQQNGKPCCRRGLNVTPEQRQPCLLKFIPIAVAERIACETQRLVSDVRGHALAAVR